MAAPQAAAAAPCLATYVISLRRSPERRAAISAALTGLGIPFSFVDAIDAKAGFGPELAQRIDRAGMQLRLGRIMSDGEIACTLSHNKAWQAFLVSEASHALILEDDALPGPELPRLLASGEYDRAGMLLLYGASRPSPRVFRGPPLLLDGDLPVWRLALPVSGAVAYIVSRPAAERLRAATDKVSGVADWPCDITDLGACLAWPHIVGHPPRVEGQSLLAPTRATKRRFGLSRYLSPAYLRRKWRKAVSRPLR